MSGLAATEPTVVGARPSGSERKHLISAESADVPTLVQSVRAVVKQSKEPLDQLPMAILEISVVEKPTISAKRQYSPVRLPSPHKRTRLGDSGDADVSAGSPLSIPSFASNEPKKGPPSLSWKSFKHPQLRRFPGSFATSKLRHVGNGIDGIVFKTRTDGGDTVAMKIFYNATQPEDFEGLYCYWAFKRECHNGAILDMITTRLEQAAANGKPVYLNPKPSTREDAFRNLECFSAEYSDDRPEHCEPVIFKTTVNPCHGWTIVDGLDINKRLYNSRGSPLLEDRRYFAIIYDYASKGKLEDEAVQAQLDFFYLAGFICLPVEERNWRGAGTLVDFSDLLAPHSRMWRSSRYGRMVKTERGLYTIITERTHCNIGIRPG
ncbi:hypothetical protein ACQKWADRAFT_83311 [Trichoderma austrokoningii]